MCASSGGLHVRVGSSMPCKLRKVSQLRAQCVLLLRPEMVVITYPSFPHLLSRCPFCSMPFPPPPSRSAGRHKEAEQWCSLSMEFLEHLSTFKDSYQQQVRCTCMHATRPTKRMEVHTRVVLNRLCIVTNQTPPVCWPFLVVHYNTENG